MEKLKRWWKYEYCNWFRGHHYEQIDGSGNLLKMTMYDLAENGFGLCEPHLYEPHESDGYWRCIHCGIVGKVKGNWMANLKHLKEPERVAIFEN